MRSAGLADVLVECLLAIGTELIAALRKQYVTGDDPFLLLLHFVDLALLSRLLCTRPLQFRRLLVVCALQYARAQRQRS